MANTIFYIIIAILAFDFLFERFLSWLNIRKIQYSLPTELQGIYDEEKYAKQQDYFRTNQRFGLITSSFSCLVTLVFLIAGGFGWLDALVRDFAGNEMLISLIFFGILFIASDLISIPFEWYDTFVIEERFGFNKTTRKTFILDKLKNYLLLGVLGGGILWIIMFVFGLTQEYFWLIAWGIMAVFSVFMNMFYSTLIVPIFNKQTPLEAGELRTRIEEFCSKAGFSLKNVYVIDGSKRSTKANAYFSGLGSRKRVVLYDTLIQTLTTEEIVAVLAHEIGHYKKKHTLEMLFFSLITTGIMFFLLSLFLGYQTDVAQALGIDKPSTEKEYFHLSLLAFGVIYTPISMILSIGMYIVSRRNEYQADAFAAKYGLADNLIDGLKKLSVKSLSNLLPHPAYVFVHYSHPTLLQRMKALTK
ncbi:MAG: M48 family metallopeptidase [Prevotellaceae bacterium]|jgi:STE24 endopeptidase|nr:M48 family metallopeptidase [Prevotellaceae bacterium]